MTNSVCKDGVTTGASLTDMARALVARINRTGTYDRRRCNDRRQGDRRQNDRREHAR